VEEWLGLLNGSKSRKRRCRDRAVARFSDFQGTVQAQEAAKKAARRQRQAAQQAAKATRSSRSSASSRMRMAADVDARYTASIRDTLDVCCLCEDGGLLIICDGPCLRSFHLACLGLDDIPGGRRWLCPDCESKSHICLACGEVGDDNVPGPNGVFKCQKRLCGRFYHRECVVPVLLFSGPSQPKTDVCCVGCCAAPQVHHEKG